MGHGFADSIISGMLGWLKGFAGWVLKLFDLAGGGGWNPLAWLSNNWLKLLIVLLIAGVALDVLVWLLRWRPYWIWFRKKRIVIDDDDFFTGEELFEAGMYDPKIFGREALKVNAPQRERAVRPSTVVKREPPRQAPGPGKKPLPGSEGKPPALKKRASGILSRLVVREEGAPASEEAQRHSPEREKALLEEKRRAPVAHSPRERERTLPQEERSAQKRRPIRPGAEGRASRPRPRFERGGERQESAHPQRHSAPDIFEDELFKIKPNDGRNQTLWEDDVFNVANLPGARPEKRPAKGRPARKRREEDALDDELFHVN